MKLPFLSLIGAFLVWLPLQRVVAGEKADCPDNSCFDTRLVSAQQDGNCTTYTLEISQDGSCRYALSHFSIEVPCGGITDVTNSGGWAMKVGATDPTTGITGIKIDDIKNFGEVKRPQSFTVTYTVCGGSCESTRPARVAYKASTCVHYEELEQPYTPMELSLKVKDVSCYGKTDGAADLTVTGGRAPFSFSWTNGALTEDLTGLPAGSYGVTITDAAGKTISREAIIAAPFALEAEAVVSGAACGANGAVALTVKGGSAPYTYLWSNGSTGSSINAAAGIYTVRVTDANNCTAGGTYTIEETGGLQLTVSGGDSCGNNELSAIISGGTEPYTYSWSTGETTAAITAAESSLFSVTVTDANGCSASAEKQVTAGGGGLSLQWDAVSPLCAYGSDGAIDLTVEGGSGNYTFEWSTGAATEDLEALRAGSYTVTVTDEGGCTASATIRITNPQSIYVRQTEIVQPDCNGGTGSISVEALYGTAPYTYEWSNGDSGSSLSNLEPDVYRLTVTDANGCTSTRSFTITAPSQPSVSISGASCSTSLTAAVSGGAAPYTYEWNTGETGSAIEIAEGGEYEVTVTDARGCSSTATISAGDPSAAISLNYDVVAPTCYGNADGSINLSLEGGAGNYTISWSNGATTEDLNGLRAGSYTVTVSNAGGCSVTETIRIAAPQAIYIRPLEVKNESCTGEGGSITAEAYYGTAPYTYEWSNGATGATIENLEAGFYNLVVTDANGCESSRRFTVLEEAAPAVSISSGGCGGSYQLVAVVAGGKAPFTYSWSNGETTESIAAGPGKYSLTVTDANGCSNTAELTVEASDSPVQLAIAVTDVSCAGGSDGSAVLQVSGGVAPYIYDWSDGNSGAEAVGLEAGLYSVQVTDAGGCSEVLAFTVKEPKAITITGVAENTSGCGEPSGKVDVQVSGGTAPYSFMWNTGAETQSISRLSAGNYTLSVEDAKGCVAIRSFKIESGAGGSMPSASMAACADTVICRGSSASLPVYFTGEGPFTLSYTDGGKDYTVTTSENPFMLEVSPLSRATYSLTGVSNACGKGEVSGQAGIQVSDCTKGQVCEDPCFDTRVVSKVQSGSCETITLQVSTSGDCRYALSHFNVAAGCGTVSSASNSKGWPMELNALDPTTGLYGIKVDEIRNFGENKGNQSFTVTYTICSDDSSCRESVSACGPLVAYKAGTCVYYDKAYEGQLHAEPVAGLSGTRLAPDFEMYPNPYQQGQVLNIDVEDLVKEGNATLTIRSITGVQFFSKNYTVSPVDNIINVVVDGLSSGFYIITIEAKGVIITKQLYVM